MSRTEDKMIEDLRDGRVATLVEDVELDSSTLQPKKQVKNEQTPNQKLLERIEELTRQREKTFVEPKSEAQSAKQEENIQEETIQEEQQEQIIESVVEEQTPSTEVETRLSRRTEIEVNAEEQNEQSTQDENKTKQRIKKVKFRIKFISIAVCIAIALFSGLAIHNAIKINQLNTQIEQTQSQVNANVAKYIYKISKVDDLIEEGKTAPVDSFQIGADRYLESYPEEIEDVTEITQSSNWFDRFVNKIRSFFKG